MSIEGRLHRAEVFLQWKGTDACYDFYCPCSPDWPQHFDGYFGGTFACGGEKDDDGSDPPGFCGKKWRLPFTLSAAEIEDDDSGGHQIAVTP